MDRNTKNIILKDRIIDGLHNVICANSTDLREIIKNILLNYNELLIN